MSTSAQLLKSKVIHPLLSYQKMAAQIIGGNERDSSDMMTKLRTATVSAGAKKEVATEAIEALNKMDSKKQKSKWGKQAAKAQKAQREYKETLCSSNETILHLKSNTAPTIIQHVLEGERLRLLSMGLRGS